MVSSGIIEMKQNGNENVQHVATFQHVVQKFLKQINELKKKYTIIIKSKCCDSLSKQKNKNKNPLHLVFNFKKSL